MVLNMRSSGCPRQATLEVSSAILSHYRFGQTNITTSIVQFSFASAIYVHFTMRLQKGSTTPISVRLLLIFGLCLQLVSSSHNGHEALHRRTKLPVPSETSNHLQLSNEYDHLLGTLTVRQTTTTNSSGQAGGGSSSSS